MRAIQLEKPPKLTQPIHIQPQSWLFGRVVYCSQGSLRRTSFDSDSHSRRRHILHGLYRYARIGCPRNKCLETFLESHRPSLPSVWAGLDSEEFVRRRFRVSEKPRHSQKNTFKKHAPRGGTQKSKNSIQNVIQKFSHSQKFGYIAL